MKDYISVSASSLSSFFRCSQMFKWQFIDEKPVDELQIYTIYGSVLHKALELHFKYGLVFEEIKVAWPSLLIAFFSEAKAFQFPEKTVLDEKIALGLRQIENVESMKDRWKEYRVLDVERYVKIPFKNSFLDNVFLTGRIDLLLESIFAHTPSVVCLDWKSSKSKEKDMDNNTQITFYTFFIRELYKYALENIYGALAYPYDGDILFTQRQEGDYQILFRQINNMLERISKKDFLKEPKLNSRPRDCFFCQYKKTCMQNEN